MRKNPFELRAELGRLKLRRRIVLDDQVLDELVFRHPRLFTLGALAFERDPQKCADRILCDLTDLPVKSVGDLDLEDYALALEIVAGIVDRVVAAAQAGKLERDIDTLMGRGSSH